MTDDDQYPYHHTRHPIQPTPPLPTSPSIHHPVPSLRHQSSDQVLSSHSNMQPNPPLRPLHPIHSHQQATSTPISIQHPPQPLSHQNLQRIDQSIDRLITPRPSSSKRKLEDDGPDSLVSHHHPRSRQESEGDDDDEEEEGEDDEDEEDDGVIRCICSINTDDGFTIQCETCEVWQHAVCVGIPIEEVPDHYYCDQCEPSIDRKRALINMASRAQSIQRERLIKESRRFQDSPSHLNINHMDDTTSNQTKPSQSPLNSLPMSRLPSTTSSNEVRPTSVKSKSNKELHEGSDKSIPSNPPTVIRKSHKRNSIQVSTSTPIVASPIERVPDNTLGLVCLMDLVHRPTYANTTSATATATITSQDIPTPAPKDVPTKKPVRRYTKSNQSRPTPLSKPSFDPIATVPNVVTTSNANSIGNVTDQDSAVPSGPTSHHHHQAVETDERYEPWRHEFTPTITDRYIDEEVKSFVSALTTEYMSTNQTLMHESEWSSSSSSSPELNQSTSSTSSSTSHHPISNTDSLPNMTPNAATNTQKLSNNEAKNTKAVDSQIFSQTEFRPITMSAIPTPAKLTIKTVPVSSINFTPSFHTNPFYPTSSSTATATAATNPNLTTAATTTAASQVSTSSLPRLITYGVYATHPIPKGTFISTLKGSIMTLTKYKSELCNQYSSLGCNKPFVKFFKSTQLSSKSKKVGVLKDGLVIDSRIYGNEMRFVRSGCHPNAVINMILSPASVGSGKMVAPDGSSGRNGFFSPNINEQEVEKLKKMDGRELLPEILDRDLHLPWNVSFGIFAASDIGRREEIILPWDWDDQHTIHLLPNLVTYSNTFEIQLQQQRSPNLSPIPHTNTNPMLKQFSPWSMTEMKILSTKMASICLTIFGLMICGCERKKSCGINLMWKLGCLSAGLPLFSIHHEGVTGDTEEERERKLLPISSLKERPLQLLNFEERFRMVLNNFIEQPNQNSTNLSINKAHRANSIPNSLHHIHNLNKNNESSGNTRGNAHSHRIKKHKIDLGPLLGFKRDWWNLTQCCDSLDQELGADHDHPPQSTNQPTKRGRKRVRSGSMISIHHQDRMATTSSPDPKLRRVSDGNISNRHDEPQLLGNQMVDDRKEQRKIDSARVSKTVVAPSPPALPPESDLFTEEAPKDLVQVQKLRPAMVQERNQHLVRGRDRRRRSLSPSKLEESEQKRKRESTSPLSRQPTPTVDYIEREEVEETDNPGMDMDSIEAPKTQSVELIDHSGSTESREVVSLKDTNMEGVWRVNEKSRHEESETSSSTSKEVTAVLNASEGLMQMTTSPLPLPPPTLTTLSPITVPLPSVSSLATPLPVTTTSTENESSSRLGLEPPHSPIADTIVARQDEQMDIDQHFLPSPPRMPPLSTEYPKQEEEEEVYRIGQLDETEEEEEEQCLDSDASTIVLKSSDEEMLLTNPTRYLGNRKRNKGKVLTAKPNAQVNKPLSPKVEQRHELHHRSIVRNSKVNHTNSSKLIKIPARSTAVVSKPRKKKAVTSDDGDEEEEEENDDDDDDDDDESKRTETTSSNKDRRRSEQVIPSSHTHKSKRFIPSSSSPIVPISSEEFKRDQKARKPSRLRISPTPPSIRSSSPMSDPPPSDEEASVESVVVNVTPNLSAELSPVAILSMPSTSIPLVASENGHHHQSTAESEMKGNDVNRLDGLDTVNEDQNGKRSDDPLPPHQELNQSIAQPDRPNVLESTARTDHHPDGPKVVESPSTVDVKERAVREASPIHKSEPPPAPEPAPAPAPAPPPPKRISLKDYRSRKVQDPVIIAPISVTSPVLRFSRMPIPETPNSRRKVSLPQPIIPDLPPLLPPNPHTQPLLPLSPRKLELVASVLKKDDHLPKEMSLKEEVEVDRPTPTSRNVSVSRDLLKMMEGFVPRSNSDGSPRKKEGGGEQGELVDDLDVRSFKKSESDRPPDQHISEKHDPDPPPQDEHTEVQEKDSDCKISESVDIDHSREVHEIRSERLETGGLEDEDLDGSTIENMSNSGEYEEDDPGQEAFEEKVEDEIRVGVEQKVDDDTTLSLRSTLQHQNPGQADIPMEDSVMGSNDPKSPDIRSNVGTESPERKLIPLDVPVSDSSLPNQSIPELDTTVKDTFKVPVQPDVPRPRLSLAAYRRRLAESKPCLPDSAPTVVLHPQQQQADATKSDAEIPSQTSRRDDEHRSPNRQALDLSSEPIDEKSSHGMTPEMTNIDQSDKVDLQHRQTSPTVSKTPVGTADSIDEGARRTAMTGSDGVVDEPKSEAESSSVKPSMYFPPFSPSIIVGGSGSPRSTLPISSPHHQSGDGVIGDESHEPTVISSPFRRSRSRTPLEPYPTSPSPPAAQPVEEQQSDDMMMTESNPTMPIRSRTSSPTPSVLPIRSTKDEEALDPTPIPDLPTAPRAFKSPTTNLSNLPPGPRAQPSLNRNHNWPKHLPNQPVARPLTRPTSYSPSAYRYSSIGPPLSDQYHQQRRIGSRSPTLKGATHDLNQHPMRVPERNPHHRARGSPLTTPSSLPSPLSGGVGINPLPSPQPPHPSHLPNKAESPTHNAPSDLPAHPTLPERASGSPRASTSTNSTSSTWPNPTLPRGPRALQQQQQQSTSSTSVNASPTFSTLRPSWSPPVTSSIRTGELIHHPTLPNPPPRPIPPEGIPARPSSHLPIPHRLPPGTSGPGPPPSGPRGSVVSGMMRNERARYEGIPRAPAAMASSSLPTYVPGNLGVSNGGRGRAKIRGGGSGPMTSLVRGHHHYHRDHSRGSGRNDR